MKSPPHPGRIIRQECIEPLGVTVTEAAARLGVTRQNLNNVLNGKSGISPEMAIRLSKAFGSRARRFSFGYRWNMIWRKRKRRSGR